MHFKDNWSCFALFSENVTVPSPFVDSSQAEIIRTVSVLVRVVSDVALLCLFSIILFVREP